MSDPGLRTAESRGLVLSLFTGAGLLDRGFKERGFCVVSAGDLFLGHDIRAFHSMPGKFDGVIGGSPCQDFADCRRTPPTGNGLAMMAEFARVVNEANPSWFILENVRRVPDFTPILGNSAFQIQRLYLRADEFGGNTRRIRCVQFGWRDGLGPLVIVRKLKSLDAAREPAALASEGARTERRGWKEFCAAQGIEPMEFPLMSREGRYALVGNGVHAGVARELARAVADRTLTPKRLCLCGCGAEVPAARTMFNATCRRRICDAKRKAVRGRLASDSPSAQELFA